MLSEPRLIYLHGSDSNSQTYKAQVLRRIYPELVVPDFSGPLAERMELINLLLHKSRGWIMIGSSLGGLMAALYASRNPDQLRKLILLAPALMEPGFIRHLPKPVPVPTLLIQGRKDDVVQPEPVYHIAQQVFPSLTYLLVDDDHRLHHTAETLDWRSILEDIDPTAPKG
jgi:pimeloyl-ACP methyl ester carboxylesterase